MQDFRRLRVWVKAHDLALDIYRTSRSLLEADRPLTLQMRRAAVSIPSNIAEGCARGSDRDFRRFLQFACGSASELEYQLLLAYDLKLLAQVDFDRLAERVVDVKRMLTGLMQTLNTSVAG